MLKLGLHKRVFILTLRNEIPKIALNRTAGGNPPNLSFAPQQKSTNLNGKCRSKVERRHLPLFLHMSFCSNMSHILQH